MKTSIIVSIFLFISMINFSQNKESVILIYNDEINEIKKKSFLFHIEDEDFRYLRKEHKKDYVSFIDISKSIISIEGLKSRTKEKLNENNIRDNFIQSYYDKYFNLFVYVKNLKCENEGVLYQVEWVLSITDPEVD